MTDPRPLVGLPRTIAVIGLVAVSVRAGFAFNVFTYESGDDVYRFFLAEAIVGAVTTAAAIWWLVWAGSRRGAAITVLVVSILINPVWSFLVIRAFG